MGEAQHPRAAVSAPLLQIRDVTVRFGALEALSSVSLNVNAGEIVGIAGANGAGKTTLFNAVSGYVRPASGDIVYEGRSIVRLAPNAIFQMGLARTFQLASVIESQSIFSNILVGAHFYHDRGLRTTLSFGRDSYAAADKALEMFGLASRASVLAGVASLYEKKLIMLASAMAGNPRLLLLDEPVGGLGPHHADLFLEYVRRAAKEGTTIIMIEHVIRALRAICSRLVILHSGRVIFDGLPESAGMDEAVRRLYLGSAIVGSIERTNWVEGSA